MELTEHPERPPSVRRPATAATLGRRLAAALVDLAIDLALVPVAMHLDHRHPSFTSRSAFVATIVAICAIVLVNEYVLVVRTGQSLGKRCAEIRVVDSATMSPPGFWQVGWRHAVMGGIGIAWHPFGWLPYAFVNPWWVVCLAPAVVDRRWHRGLHDRWARTVVIDVRGERTRDAPHPGSPPY